MASFCVICIYLYVYVHLYLHIYARLEVWSCLPIICGCCTLKARLSTYGHLQILKTAVADRPQIEASFYYMQCGMSSLLNLTSKGDCGTGLVRVCEG